MTSTGTRRYRKILVRTAAILVSIVVLFFIIVNRFVEPVLRDRLHTFIIQGSDSLYTYTLGDIKANFFGGNVEVENLQINVDSSRYQVLRNRNALPSLTMQLSLEKASINGLSILPMLFNKRIVIDEIKSSEANIRLSRHARPDDVESVQRPLWKSIQPGIKGISVKQIRFDGVKLLYKHADTSESIKLQFDRCDADFGDIDIDSTSALDSSRVLFAKEVYTRFHDLKFRTADSSYKMKAEWITYSSKENSFVIDSFKLQPTLEIPDYYAKTKTQKSLYFIEFARIKFVNTSLDQFIHKDIILADSVIFFRPDISVYMDKSAPFPDYVTKIGKFPHQRLLAATTRIFIKSISLDHANISYKEKNAETLREGQLYISQLKLSADNVTNEPAIIRNNPVCAVHASGNILGSSPFDINFNLRLDSTNGTFDAKGWIKTISATQLNTISMPLAGMLFNSCMIHQIDFHVKGEDYGSTSDVRMRYNNLAMTVKEVDVETGKTKTKNFITKLLNRFVLYSDNPVAGQPERISANKKFMRLTRHSFFGLLWKSIFAGMQDIIMKTGRYE